MNVKPYNYIREVKLIWLVIDRSLYDSLAIFFVYFLHFIVPRGRYHILIVIGNVFTQL